MRRRLTVAMVGVALGSLALVAVGVVGIAQLGAREEAEERVVNQLDSLSEFLADLRGPTRLGPALVRAEAAFGIGRAQVVNVDLGNGTVTTSQSPQARRPPGSGDGDTDALDLSLDQAQLAAFVSGEAVVVEANRSQARGIRALNRGGDSDTNAIMVESPVDRIPDSVTGWFLLSAALVMAAATALAAWMAGRFVAPVRAIEATTQSLAAGDLSARVPDQDGPSELKELGATVNQMATEMERSRAAERQFLLSVSHDLRTPLAVIRGYAEGLSDEAFDDPVAVGTTIETHAGRLERLVDDLLDLAKLDTQQFSLNPEPLDLSVIAGRVTAGFTNQAARDNVSLRFEGTPTPVVADPDRLAQVVGNLIDNACKFARSDVLVTVGSHPQPVIKVRDDGPGVPPEDQPFIFDRLYQSTAAPRRAESATGMGLAIVKQLTEAMGGEVRLESGSGGTTVSILLPPAA